MLTASKENNGSRYNSADNGKCICVSFPAHELNLIEELDDLANQEDHHSIPVHPPNDPP